MNTARAESHYKRKFPRRIFPRAIGLLIDGVYYLGQGQEMGEGGMSFFLPKLCQLAAEGVISFQIPGGSFISVRVEIRSSAQAEKGEYIIGCLFKNLKFEHKREIRSYVSARPDFQ